MIRSQIEKARGIQSLRQKQSLPLEAKVQMSLRRIREWYEHWDGDVSVSFSGGKDSTVLLHLVRSIYPEVPAVFFNTGLEYPEVRQFVKETPNTLWIKPKLTFRQVIEKYGWPVISKDQATAIDRYRNTKSPLQKHRRIHGWPAGKKGTISKKWMHLIDAPFKISATCCDALKRRPANKFEKESGLKPMVGILAGDSNSRRTLYAKRQCNAFDAKLPNSWPLAFWTEANIWSYIRSRNLSYSPIYDMGEHNTGCVFCAFGVHMESEPNRFQRMAQHHPKLHKYCIEQLGLGEVLGFLEVPYR